MDLSWNIHFSLETFLKIRTHQKYVNTLSVVGKDKTVEANEVKRKIFRNILKMFVRKFTFEANIKIRKN